MNGIRYALRKAVGRPITNREHELSKGLDSSISYSHFEFVVMQGKVMSLPKSERFGAWKQWSEEWGAWLDAPYVPGKVFSPTYGTTAKEET